MSCDFASISRFAPTPVLQHASKATHYEALGKAQRLLAARRSRPRHAVRRRPRTIVALELRSFDDECGVQMVVHEIVIAVAGLMAAGIVKGATGIGYSTTALPIVALAIGLDRAMPLVILPSIASNLIVMRDAGAMRETVIRFRSLFLALLPGLALGLAALAWIDTERAARVLGGVIALYAIYALARPPLRLPEGSERLLNIPVGLVNGLINGLTGSQIMPVVPYALSLGLTTEGVLQLTNISFTISSLVMLVGLYKIGLADGTTFLVSALCILPGAIGVMLGTRLRHQFAEGTFRTLVLVVLMVLGVLLISGR